MEKQILVQKKISGNIMEQIQHLQIYNGTKILDGMRIVLEYQLKVNMLQ
jgi:hypothetical protein